LRTFLESEDVDGESSMLSKSSRTYLIRVVILKNLSSVELDIVQDADRLDALGAINCSDV
jgi:hypothetical protein